MSNEQPPRIPESQTQRLERFITAACRAQPPLSVPADLQARVMAAIERRAREWWRASLPAWPRWAQVVLLLLCLCCVWLASGSTVFTGGESFMGQWLFMPLMLADIFSNLLSVLQHLLWMVLNISPVLWLFAVTVGGMVVAAGVVGLTRLTTPHIG